MVSLAKLYRTAVTKVEFHRLLHFLWITKSKAHYLDSEFIVFFL